MKSMRFIPISLPAHYRYWCEDKEALALIKKLMKRRYWFDAEYGNHGWYITCGVVPDAMKELYGKPLTKDVNT